MGIEQNGRTPRLVPAQSHAAYMSTRPCNCAPSAMTNRGAEIAPSTEPVSPMLTSSLAWMLPFTLPRTTIDFADNCALTLPVGPTVRTCCRSSIVPSTSPSMTRSSPPLTSASMTTPFPIVVMPSGACGRRHAVRAATPPR